MSTPEFKPAVDRPTFINGKNLEAAGIEGVILQGVLENIQEGEYKGKTTYSYSFKATSPLELEGLGSISEEDVVVVNGCASLDRQLGVVEKGTLCRISYNGKKSGKTGNPFHDFFVEIA